jgi:hypothetical protein
MPGPVYAGSGDSWLGWSWLGWSWLTNDDVGCVFWIVGARSSLDMWLAR